MKASCREFVLPLLLWPPVHAQIDAAALRTTFAALPAAEQLAVLRRVDERLQRSDDPALQRLAPLVQEGRDPPPLRPRTFHDPKVYAPVAPERIVVDPGDAAHAAVRGDFPVVQPLRDFVPAVAYDWAFGVPARCTGQPSPAQRFANLCAGFPPGADAAMAALLARLDLDGDQRLLARWCGQLYADRNGRVFAGISLYEAWYSGRTIEVPDVDAIAFARAILQTDAFVSPIPDGARRDRLYQQVKRGFARYREYRTLLEAAAATFVTVRPTLDPTYQPLVDRLHLLWGDCDNDIDRMAERLGAQGRSELIELLDRRLQNDVGALDVVNARKAQMAALADTVRAAAAEALAASRQR